MEEEMNTASDENFEMMSPPRLNSNDQQGSSSSSSSSQTQSQQPNHEVDLPSEEVTRESQEGGDKLGPLYVNTNEPWLGSMEVLDGFAEDKVKEEKIREFVETAIATQRSDNQQSIEDPENQPGGSSPSKMDLEIPDDECPDIE